jgi:hypothetical protein
VDGSPVGTIQDSGCRTYVVSKSDAHTFCIDEEIGGGCSTYEGTTVCTRYLSPGTCWTVEAIKKERICESIPMCQWICEWGCPCPDCPKPIYCGEGCVPPPCPSCPCKPRCGYVCVEYRQCRYEEEAGDEGYTFEYFAEHQVSVSNPHGDNIDEWIRDGNTLNFYAKEEISIKDEKTVKERDVFDFWNINGAPNENEVISLTINKPYIAKAKYSKEREYNIEASSQLRKTYPTGGGWYPEKTEASLSIEEEMPLEGWKGSWGGKYFFIEWRGDKGTVLRRATSTFIVEESQTFEAIYEADDSAAMMKLYLLIIIIIVVIAAIILGVLYRTGHLIQKKEPKVKPDKDVKELKAEIEELKKELKKKK